ncbi:MAG: rhodanese-like domain-containing protein, partial [Nitrospinales bacterium]
MSRKITACLALIFLAFIERLSPVLWALPAETGPSMSVNRLQTLSSKETILIDTRPSWKFFVGHIPGAISLNDWREFTERRNG